MIELWKLKREASRLRVQLAGALAWIPERLSQARYDRQRDTRIVTATGKIAVRPRVAIFVVYQPNGVAPSIFATCRHLEKNGYAVVVVSNGPLAESDRGTLCESAHLVAERPNFGYDFGGFRDGLWLLDAFDIHADEVLFLNDSVWFPITEHPGLLAEFAKSDADYVGVQVFGDPAAEGRKRGFFGSYCFLVRRPALDASAFRAFWANYRLTSNKEITLRLGERACSRMLLDVAGKSEGLYSIDRFRETLASLSSDALHEALDDAVIPDRKIAARRQELLEGERTATFEESARALLIEASRTKNYIGSSPVVSIREMGFQMIKKNNEMLYLMARERIIKAVDEGRLSGLDPIVLDEMRKRTRQQA